MLALIGLIGLALTGAALLPTVEIEESPDPAGDEASDPALEVLPLDDAPGFDAADGETSLPEDAPTGDVAASDAPANALHEGATGTAEPQRLSDVGTARPDVIFGTPASDDIDAGAGNDHVDLRDGDDRALGGDGADEMHGGRGADALRGEEGDDALWGHVGDDALWGDAGHDRLSGGDGADLLRGGAGADALAGDLGDDDLDGGDGRDVLHGGAGDDRLSGASDGAADWLNGGDGDDEIHAGAGDTAHGGTGGDLFALRSMEAGEAAVIVDFDAAQDQIMVLHPPGLVPELTAEAVPEGLLLRADGAALARLDGITALAPDAVVLLADSAA
ncbi:calcium-binding protein [Limimaricola litoreus]|uniref:Hemolysin-type calcium-binding repeat-containing protein n=1 Tax=Limimaricola litoreus TaxID=2955316 RepID=A0A9X2JMN7_9RHOB|nr:hypothetical protein [Limimaricola litoreus]MCP1167023.1 hypothetical protein [Limimaricola litoreus]